MLAPTEDEHSFLFILSIDPLASDRVADGKDRGALHAKRNNGEGGGIQLDASCC